MQLKTAGDLRGFLAEVLVGVREGTIDANKANAISKVAAQINQSLATEVTTRIRLKELGADDAGQMLIGRGDAGPAQVVEAIAEVVEPVPVLPAEEATAAISEPVQPPATTPQPRVTLEDATANYRRAKADGDKIWCEQCELRVTTSQAISCKSKFCTAKAAA